MKAMVALTAPLAGCRHCWSPLPVVKGRISKASPQGKLERLPASHALPPELVFDSVSLIVMPVYALMIFKPESNATKEVVEIVANRFFALAAVVYLCLLLHWRLNPLAFDLSTLATLMAREKNAAITWSHLLLLDLYQSVWVYRDSLSSGRVNPLVNGLCLAVCFFMGPVGFLMYMFFRARNRKSINTCPIN
jgi:hypothetical protein